MIKTKTWILILVGILLLSVVAIVVMNKVAGSSSLAKIYIDGECTKTIDLQKSDDEIFVIETENGSNTVEIKDHKICIVDADCPDKTCVKMGWLDSAEPIVCLPHKVVIKLESTQNNGETAIDSVTK